MGDSDMRESEFPTLFDSQQEEKLAQKEKEEEVEKALEVPNWVKSLIKKTFFGKCNQRAQFQSCELKIYCIDCESALCKRCISTGTIHHEHKLLRIYRHVYKDAVQVDDMSVHFDISKIQTYKCNKKSVVAFNPLPHKGSGSQCSDPIESCDVCQRKLLEPDLHRFCSIACKVEACSKKVNVKNDQDNAQGSNSFRKRKRKGTLHRAPFF